MADVPQHHPFRELRSREHITFVFTDLADRFGGAFYARQGDRALIGVSKSLRRVERSAAVAHEIAHEDIGANEERVRDHVARWLVPFDELGAMYSVAVTNDLPVEAWMVAEKFDVPQDVAERAMRLFLGEVAA